MKLELRCDWPEFTFTLDEMKLVVPHTTSGWMVKVQSMKNKVRKHLPLQLLLNLSCISSQIAESEVDFWQYDVDMLKLYQEIRRYPPKITINLHGSRATDVCELEVKFLGTTPFLQDSITISSEG